MTGKWEAVADEEGQGGEEEFWRVRWSIPDEQDRHLYVRHYGGNGTVWNRNAAVRQAEEFNEQGRSPQSFASEFRPMREVPSEPAGA